MSSEAAIARGKARDRAKAIALREKECKEVDLVAKALENPESLTEVQRLALLGRPAYREDAHGFLSALNGFNPKMRRMQIFIDSATAMHARLANVTPELCKFTLCDWRVPPDFEPGQDGNAAVDALYEEQLRLEREQDPLEKARAAVRREDERRARYNAAKVLAQHQAAAAAGETFNPSTVHSVVSQVPDWVNRIFLSREDYGFVIYESREAYRRPLMAKETWRTVFNETDRRNNFGGYKNAAGTVYVGGLLRPYMLPSWVEQCLHHQPSEANPSALRRHFHGLWDSIHAPGPRILRDTFLVLTDDCLFPELDSCFMPKRNYLDDAQFLVPLLPSPVLRTVGPEKLPTFFLWAYDANWEPPSGTGTGTKNMKDEPHADDNQAEDKEAKGKEIDHAYREGMTQAECTCNGHFAGDANTVWADEDGYEGRVKVDIQRLFSWFYYARLEGYDMKQLWRKAQTLPHQTWTCLADPIDNTKPGELV